jgi:hypothetical protein
MNRVLAGLAVAGFAALAPVTATPSGTLAPNRACAQADEGGMCCQEETSICIIDAVAYRDNYFLAEGKCR